MFDSASDEEWLALLDTGYLFGIEVVAPLSGSRSGGARAIAYLGFYLNESGQRRAPCVVKIGHSEPIRRDFQGWQDFIRHQPDRDSFSSMSPPLEASFGAIVITDFVGSGEVPLQSLANALEDSSFALLAETIERLVLGTLAPLHEASIRGAAIRPQLVRTQGAMLEYWVDRNIRALALDRLQRADAGLETWSEREVQDRVHMLRASNHLVGLLSGDGLPGAQLLARVPLGAVHGDPNFDNVFLAHRTPPGELVGLALIDFEWCRCGAEDSPYDDLACLECEALFGHIELPRRRQLSLALALGEPWLRDSRSIVATDGPERQVYRAVETLRRRAAALAGETGAQEVNEFQRGYLLTLLGQAIRRVAYDGPDGDVRAEALFYCQLLAARLALPLSNGPTAAFPVTPVATARGSARVERQGEDYLLSALDANAYASLVLDRQAPHGDVLLLCEVELLSEGDGGWFALSLGVDPAGPERSGLSGAMRWGTGELGRGGIQSHMSSRDRSPLHEFPLADLRRAPVRLSIEMAGASVRFEARRPGRAPFCVANVRVPPDRYRGPLAVSAHASELLVRSLWASVPPAPSFDGATNV